MAKWVERRRSALSVAPKDVGDFETLRPAEAQPASVRFGTLLQRHNAKARALQTVKNIKMNPYGNSSRQDEDGSDDEIQGSEDDEGDDEVTQDDDDDEAVEPFLAGSGKLPHNCPPFKRNGQLGTCFSCSPSGVSDGSHLESVTPQTKHVQPSDMPE